MNSNDKPKPAERKWNHIPKQYRLYELSDEENKTLHTAIEKLKVRRRRAEGIKGINGVARNTMLEFNAHYANPPLYCCFNNWGEPLFFMDGNEVKRPVYAMHSYHAVVQTWKEKRRLHEHLAKHYFDEIVTTCNKTPILVGICQGGPIMESIAILFLHKFNIKPLLITLEYYPRRNYQGPMVLLFGKESLFNPFYNSSVNPVKEWKSSLHDFGWGIIDAAHSDFFREPGLSQLRQFITRSIDIHERGSRFRKREIKLQEKPGTGFLSDKMVQALQGIFDKVRSFKQRGAFPF